MKRRFIWILIMVLILGISVFAGGILAKPIELKYWGIWTGDPFGKIEKQVIERFNSLHEGKIRGARGPSR